MSDDDAQSVFGAMYSSRSMDLARYRDDSLDDVIGDLVDSRGARGPRVWKDTQEQLTEGDSYALFTFANRRSALALRTGMAGFAEQAIRGLALIATNHVDPRDMTVDFPLYALSRSSGGLDRSLAFAMERSQPDMRSYFKSRAKAKLSLHDCGLLEVRSRHGLGFMETWWRPTPRNPDLPVSAIAVADRIDEGGRYAVESIRVSALGWVWFDRSRTGDEMPSSGCVTISAGLVGTPPLSHRFLVFLADFEDEATARAVADMARGASRENDLQTAVNAGPRVLTVVGDWPTALGGRAETQASLSRIADDLAGAAFGGEHRTHIARR